MLEIWLSGPEKRVVPLSGITLHFELLQRSTFSSPIDTPWKFRDQWTLPVEVSKFSRGTVLRPRVPSALWLKHMEKRRTPALSRKLGTLILGFKLWDSESVF